MSGMVRKPRSTGMRRIFQREHRGDEAFPQSSEERQCREGWIPPLTLLSGLPGTSKSLEVRGDPKNKGLDEALFLLLCEWEFQVKNNYGK